MPVDVVDKIIESMDNQISLVTNSKGQRTKYQAYTCQISRNTEFEDERMAYYSSAHILVRILRHTSDKLTIKKDCLVSGYHDGVNFFVTLINQ